VTVGTAVAIILTRKSKTSGITPGFTANITESQ
jgi:hypothetical protein